MLVLLVAIILVWWHGDRSLARVREFNWDNRQISGRDRAMLFTFNRPMDRASVEKNFRIDPPLPGKFSWAGRRMAYTLDFPLPYTGEAHTVQLQGAQDRLRQGSESGVVMQPFRSQFQSRDRVFAYIGVQGEEANRLVLYNLTRKQQTLLTPANLVVTDFKPYPGGDRILVAASDRTAFEQGKGERQLYDVTTGLQYRPVESVLPGGTAPGTSLFPAQRPANPKAGEMTLRLDSTHYDNLRFDLSPDGQTILVQRADKRNPGGKFGLWTLRPEGEPKPFPAQPGGEFRIAPDGASLVMAQGQGMAVLSLQSGEKPLDFLPNFGQLLDFSADGAQAALVQFNTDYTSALFLVTIQGVQQELLRVNGAITQARFDPTGQMLYALVAERGESAQVYEEQPRLVSLNLRQLRPKEGDKGQDKLTPPKPVILHDLPLNQRDVSLSMAPDGLALLFDVVQAGQQTDPQTGPRGSDGAAIATSQLWAMPLVPPAFADQSPAEPIQATALNIQGLRPQWLP